MKHSRLRALTRALTTAGLAAVIVGTVLFQASRAVPPVTGRPTAAVPTSPAPPAAPGRPAGDRAGDAAGSGPAQAAATKPTDPPGQGAGPAFVSREPSDTGGSLDDKELASPAGSGPAPAPASSGHAQATVVRESRTPIISEASVRLQPSFRRQVLAAISGPAKSHLTFPLSDGRACDLVITSHEARDGREGVVLATVADEPLSHAVLAYSDDAVAGTILTGDGELFQVRYAGNGTHRVRQLDPTRFEDELPPLDPTAAAGAPAHDHRPTVPVANLDVDEGATPVSAQAGDPTAVQDAPVAEADVARALPKDGSDIILDVMVVYTADARAANGGASGMRALINAAIASANLAYANGRTGTALRLAYAAEVTYTASGALGTDLTRLRTTNDSIMDEIHAWRDQYKADIVSLIVSGASDAAGIGYLWSPGGASTFASYAFNVVVDIYADSNLTLAHEIGHNLGAGHALGDSASGGAYSYSYGYRFVAGGVTYRTVMAYAPGIRIPYISSPSVTYLGAAVGTASADNARTIVSDRAALAASRSGYPDWTVGTQADMNGDGKPDLVWRNLLTGRVITWLMNDATTTSTAALWPSTNPGESDWVPMVSADLNADGQVDLVWRNASTGRVIVWYMSGTTRTSTAVIWPATNPGESDWIPLVAGDFNADGRPDLIWRNASTGRVIVWYMNGITRTGSATVWGATNPGESDWVPMASGDFNADGRPDLVWRNSSTGRVIVWYVNGVTRTGGAELWAATNAGESAWVPMAAGDFNADGQIDLVWRNSSTGRVIIWYMNGVTRTSTTAIWGT